MEQKTQEKMQCQYKRTYMYITRIVHGCHVIIGYNAFA